MNNPGNDVLKLDFNKQNRLEIVRSFEEFH